MSRFRGNFYSAPTINRFTLEDIFDTKATFESASIAQIDSPEMNNTPYQFL